MLQLFYTLLIFWVLCLIITFIFSASLLHLLLHSNRITNYYCWYLQSPFVSTNHTAKEILFNICACKQQWCRSRGTQEGVIPLAADWRGFSPRSLGGYLGSERLYREHKYHKKILTFVFPIVLISHRIKKLSLLDQIPSFLYKFV